MRLTTYGSRLNRLERELRELKRLVKPSTRNSVTVAVTTLAPELFELLRDIPVIVRAVDRGYVASFVDANVNASGDSPNDAVANLKDVMVGLFDLLASKPRQVLGKGPARQLAVLCEIMRRKNGHGVHHERARSKDLKAHNFDEVWGHYETT